MRLELFSRARRVAARRPWTVWAVATGLTLVVASAVHSSLVALDEQRATWGETRRVWVATATVEAGEPVAGRIELRAVPLPVVPDGLLDLDGPPSPSTLATQRVGVGEIVTEHDVTAPDGAATLAPPGWVTVAVREPIATGASVGHDVTISADGAVLAAEAIVVGTLDDAVLVAVPPVDGPAVAAAASESRATLLVHE